MKKLLSGLLLFIFLTNNSQTLILTKAANEPVIGDTSRSLLIDTSAYVSGLNVSLTGGNTVWTYTNLVGTSNSLTSSYLSPASSPSPANYPGCTVVQKQGTLYSYFKSVTSPSTQLEFMGVTSNSLTMNFTNTAVFAKYPFTFGNTFTDSFSGSFTFSTSGTANGNATVTADGTGTLNIPDGTFTNVLRVKSYQVINFSVGIFPAGSLKQTVYNFYHATQKFPLLTIDYTTLTITGQTPSVTTQVSGNKNNFTVGLKENVINNLNAKLYPNPADNVLNVYIDDLAKAKEILIFNELGQKVYKSVFENKIDINTLPKGIYIIEIKTEQGSFRKKFVKE